MEPNPRFGAFSAATSRAKSAAHERISVIFRGIANGERLDGGARWIRTLGRRKHQVKLCDIETNCKALSPCGAFLVCFRVAGSDRGKMACPFIGSLLRHQSRCRSSRRMGRSHSNVADRISRPGIRPSGRPIKIDQHGIHYFCLLGERPARTRRVAEVGGVKILVARMGRTRSLMARR
jgi:hypothetical protein